MAKHRRVCCKTSLCVCVCVRGGGGNERKSAVCTGALMLQWGNNFTVMIMMLSGLLPVTDQGCRQDHAQGRRRAPDLVLKIGPDPVPGHNLLVDGGGGLGLALTLRLSPLLVAHLLNDDLLYVKWRPNKSPHHRSPHRGLYRHKMTGPTLSSKYPSLCPPPWAQSHV